MSGVIGSEILIRRSFTNPPARIEGEILGVTDLISSVNAQAQTSPAEPIASSNISSKGDIFFDRSFLSIEESIIKSRTRELDTHKSVTIPLPLPLPQNVSVVDVKNGELVTIIWDPFEYDGMVVVSRAEDGQEESKIADVPTNARGFHDTTVDVGRRYSYTFATVSKDGEKSASIGPFTVGPIEDLLAPPPPSAVLYSVTADGFVEITWIDPPVSDFESVVVYRSITKGSAGTRIYKVASGIQTYTDRDVLEGRTYYYLLRSEDVNGNESANEIVESRLGNPAIFTPVF